MCRYLISLPGSLLLPTILVCLAVAQDAPSVRAKPKIENESSIDLSDKALEALGEVVTAYIEKEYAIGAELLVMQHGKTLFHQCFGLSDREDNNKWQPGTLANIRSMTKPITGAAAQILVDRGLLDLDAPVADYLESFDNEESRGITVRQVLTHRSGLPLTNLIKVDTFENLAAQVAAAGKSGPQFEPDSKFWYRDIGTDVVGALIEELSGEPLQEFVTREILEPLGMRDTWYGIDANDSRFSRVATLYFGTPGGWLKIWKPARQTL